ncbi:MAG TPA: hypothetical protein PK765_02250 [bacterium]|nr:hypothetical protein [bacterium]
MIPKPQDHSAATYTRKIEKEDGLLRYDTDPKTLHDRIRSLTPWPGAYDFFVGRQLRFDRTDTEFGSPIAPTGTVERIPHGDPGRIGIAVDGGWLILRSVTIE